MLFSILATAVCFVVCHGGPADHFATFAENLSNKDIETIEIYASGPALKKFQERGIEVTTPFFLDSLSPEEEDELADHIALACSTAKVVITDVGHLFDIKIQKALARKATDVARFAYYDNPERYVPGYSEIAAEVMQETQVILFANSNLIHTSISQVSGKKIDFGNQKKIGIGYYPIKQAEKIATRRIEEKDILRHTLLQKNHLVDTDQKVLVYFGGNNEEYFSKALPAFLSLLEQGMQKSDFTNLVIVLQQHPGAKTKNIDRQLFEDWVSRHRQNVHTPTIIISDSNSDDAQTVADGAFYYQTSMGPQFVLANIPTIQIGHETYEDILVKNNLSPSVTTADQLIQCIDNLNQQKKEIPREIILAGLGIKKDWLQILETAIKMSE